jgi:hypothetical protein
MASIRPVGVLGSAVGHAALTMSSARAVASLSLVEDGALGVVGINRSRTHCAYHSDH